MSYFLLLTYLIVSTPFLNAQKEKITGTVTSNESVLQGIEVVNVTSKETSITNNFGIFSIVAKVGDEIVFVSKNYQYKTIIIKESDFKNYKLVIKLDQKTEELDEVIITNKVVAPVIPDMQELLDRQVADDKYSQKKNPFGTDGSITYGPDIFKIIKLFTRGKTKKSKEVPKIGFKEVTENNLSQDFFIKSLKLKAEEIPLFLEFCDTDPKSKKLKESSNDLELIEFLLAKKIEFRKIKKE